jgi:hypothetical protein
VAQDGTIATSQHRGHLLGQRVDDRADQIDAAVQAAQAICPQPTVDPSGAEPGTQELTASDHPVLASRQRCDRPLARPRITDNFPLARSCEPVGKFTAHIAENPRGTFSAPHDWEVVGEAGRPFPTQPCS